MSVHLKIMYVVNKNASTCKARVGLAKIYSLNLTIAECNQPIEALKISMYLVNYIFF